MFLIIYAGPGVAYLQGPLVFLVRKGPKPPFLLPGEGAHEIFVLAGELGVGDFLPLLGYPGPIGKGDVECLADHSAGEKGVSDFGGGVRFFADSVHLRVLRFVLF